MKNNFKVYKYLEKEKWCKSLILHPLRKMEEKIDYINLIDVSKMNLNNYINIAMQNYKENRMKEYKDRLIDLIKFRKKLFLFDKEIIKTYL